MREDISKKEISKEVSGEEAIKEAVQKTENDIKEVVREKDSADTEEKRRKKSDSGDIEEKRQKKSASAAEEKSQRESDSGDSKEKSQRKSDSGEWVDDGKTIVNMNVEGMPWYRPELPDEPEEGFKPISLSQEEGRAAMWGALKAALLVAGIFILGFFLFLLFCDNIWFK